MSEPSIENAEQSQNTSGGLSPNGTAAEQLSKAKMALYGAANLPTSIVGLPIALSIEKPCYNFYPPVDCYQARPGRYILAAEVVW